MFQESQEEVQRAIKNHDSGLLLTPIDILRQASAEADVSHQMLIQEEERQRSLESDSIDGIGEEEK